MQNIIGGHIFHVIKAHDLTQHFYGSSFVLERENVEDDFFYKSFTMGKRCAKKGANN
jgi:hypothetical protein